MHMFPSELRFHAFKGPANFGGYSLGILSLLVNHSLSTWPITHSPLHPQQPHTPPSLLFISALANPHSCPPPTPVSSLWPTFTAQHHPTKPPFTPSLRFTQPSHIVTTPVSLRPLRLPFGNERAIVECGYKRGLIAWDWWKWDYWKEEWDEQLAAWKEWWWWKGRRWRTGGKSV